MQAPTGWGVSNRVSAAGYNWSAVGENIAAGYSSVDTVMQGWLESPGHCRDIMGKQFRMFAVSRVDFSDADFSNYWTQVFSAQP
ncbi:CAP domain-containing protein [Saccharospirillum impatiens]|uniref:CAP domain-containing protein n=1 Tax=Saccharospirillum impatiens TaxID=169438 RepID=UPI000A06FEC0